MKYPRNERQAHAEMARGMDVRQAEPQQSRIAEFVSVFRQYSRHGIVYAAKRAYGIAFRGLPF
jgi:hypothetical protein